MAVFWLLMISADVYANDPRAIKIAAAAYSLNELRDNWLKLTDLINRVPEVALGYPDRTRPEDEVAASEL